MLLVASLALSSGSSVALRAPPVLMAAEPKKAATPETSGAAFAKVDVSAAASAAKASLSLERRTATEAALDAIRDRAFANLDAAGAGNLPTYTPINIWSDDNNCYDVLDAIKARAFSRFDLAARAPIARPRAPIARPATMPIIVDPVKEVQATVVEATVVEPAAAPLVVSTFNASSSVALFGTGMLLFAATALVGHDLHHLASILPTFTAVSTTTTTVATTRS